LAILIRLLADLRTDPALRRADHAFVNFLPMASSFQFLRTKLLFLGACVSFLSASPTSRAQLIDTGTPIVPYYSTLLETSFFPENPNNYSGAAAKISFSAPTTITAIQVWINVLTTGFLAFEIAPDSGGKPGPELDFLGGLFFNTYGSQWYGMRLDWSLDAGDYWFELIPYFNSGNFFMQGPPPNPLSEYLFQKSTSNGWQPSTNSFGLRIYGVQAPISSVPESSAYGYGVTSVLVLFVVLRKRSSILAKRKDMTHY